MKRDQYPLRTKVMAGTLTAIGLLGIAGCTTSRGASAQTSRSSEASTSAPATPKTATPEMTQNRTVSAEVLNAQARFEGASKKVTLEILSLMADPRSHSAGYDQFWYGNKSGLQKAGEDRSTKPEMFVQYFDGRTANEPRGMFISADRSENPQAANTDLIFDQETIGLDVGTTPNELDAKIKAGKQLTIQDYTEFVESHPVTVITATTQHGNPIATTTINHAPDGTYTYAAMDGNDHGTGPFVIDMPNVDKLDQFSQDLQQTADGMKQSL